MRCDWVRDSRMSAFGGKADLIQGLAEGPLIAISRPLVDEDHGEKKRWERYVRMTTNLAKWPSGHGQIIKSGLSYGRRE